ncbi:MAG: hypothetical protein AAFU79_06675, partial [Myxococcota bacterium]
AVCGLFDARRNEMIDTKKSIGWTLLAGVFAFSADAQANPGWSPYGSYPVLEIGSDLNSANFDLVQPGDCATQRDGSIVCQDPAAAGNGRDQSQQFSDIFARSFRDQLQIGRLGVDLLFGGRGDDVLVGGVEHFSANNRDKAFGGRGSDIFIWKPGDGSDFYSGGRGVDAIVFGLVGEVDDEGHPAFEVVNDGLAGDVFIDDETGLPKVDVSGSPGFCSVVDGASSPSAAHDLEALGLDHLVRFSIRGVANAFESGAQSTDNGLRVTLHLKDVEFVVCTNRDGGHIEVIDLRTEPAQVISLDHIHPRRLRNRLESIVF